MANGERRARLTKSALRALQSAREAARRASRTDFTPPADLARGATPSPSMPPVERFTPSPLPSEGAPDPSAPPARPVRSSATPESTTAAGATPRGTTPPRPRRGERRGERRSERRSFGAASPTAATPSAPLTSEEAELVELIDRLAVVADGSGLAEIEIAVAGTRVVVRSRAALVPSNVVAVTGPAPIAAAPTTAPSVVPPEGSAAPKAAPIAPTPSSPSAAFVAAPLTGVFYAARSPGDDPLVAVGSVVAVGQPIGLIEAMKLFNEIKSDRAGRVVRVLAENGRLVKAKAPIIEVEPA